jgi:hypothetical protein
MPIAFRLLKVKDAYDFIVCMKESIHSVVIIGKTFKIPIVKSSGYNTNYENTRM